MTEAEWQHCTTKPALMARRLRDSLSPRKRQLLACALCRLLPAGALEPWCLVALDAAERFAEGDLPASEFRAVSESVRAAYDDLEIRQATRGDVPEEAVAAVNAVFNTCGTSDVMKSLPALMEHVQRYVQLTTPTGLKGKAEAALRERQCQTIRELAASPNLEYRRLGSATLPAIGFPDGSEFKVPETARAIAAAVHAEQAFDRLPILADALEDEGCHETKLLDHLRHGVDHLRGCWALDLIVGRG